MARVLIEMVPRALSTEESKLTANDIEIRFQIPHPCDMRTKDLEITILASDYPKRKIDLQDKRAPFIAKSLQEAMSERNISCFIFIILGPSAFVEF